MRRGQLQTMEPIIIVVFLVIIVGVLLMYYLRIAESDSRQSTRSQESVQDLAVLKRIAGMPELSCPKSETGQTYCIDLYKAQAFQERMQNPKERLAYYPFFGEAQINLTIIDLNSGAQTMTLYDTLNSTTLRPSVVYTTVYTPLRYSGEPKRKFAMITITRGK